MPTEVIYHIEKAEQISTKSGRVIMVVSLVDEDGTSFKAFPAGCLKNDLRDFGWGDEWFIKSLGKWPAPETQTKAITTMRSWDVNTYPSCIL